MIFTWKFVPNIDRKLPDKHIKNLEQNLKFEISKNQNIIDEQLYKLLKLATPNQAGDVKEILNKLSEIINSIPLSSLNPQKFASMGKIMKEFYILQSSPQVEELLLFTFGFHGYIESIQGIHKNIVNKKIWLLNYQT